MARPSQEEMIAEAVRFAITIGNDADHAAALGLARYRQSAGPSFFVPDAIKIIRQVDKDYPDAPVQRLLDAVEPFIELLEPQFDDPPLTDEDFQRHDVHMMLIGDGELGVMPLACFRRLRDAAKALT